MCQYYKCTEPYTTIYLYWTRYEHLAPTRPFTVEAEHIFHENKVNVPKFQNEKQVQYVAVYEWAYNVQH